MTQSEFQQTGGALSQTQAILCELQAHLGLWVPMPHLAFAARCFSVRSRIDELRKRGHTIVNKSERDQTTKQVHSYYMLVPKSAVETADAYAQAIMEG